MAHIHSVEFRESLPLTAPSFENAFEVFGSGWRRFQRVSWQPCGNPLTTLPGERRLRLGSCLARLPCLKLCYANISFGHPWTPFGSSFSTLMGGSRFSATVAQVFQSRDMIYLRSQITYLPGHVVGRKHMFYDLIRRLAIFDIPLAQIHHRLWSAVIASHDSRRRLTKTSCALSS